mmetsp:Transcript_95818/g.247747  ORF Transcript_95818/g.247747 Transcript_95818/m.247747 type:complete len:204 (+) Transcript_95818:490-1101(+)
MQHVDELFTNAVRCVIWHRDVHGRPVGFFNEVDDDQHLRCGARHGRKLPVGQLLRVLGHSVADAVAAHCRARAADAAERTRGVKDCIAHGGVEQRLLAPVRPQRLLHAASNQRLLVDTRDGRAQTHRAREHVLTPVALLHLVGAIRVVTPFQDGITHELIEPVIQEVIVGITRFHAEPVHALLEAVVDGGDEGPRHGYGLSRN